MVGRFGFALERFHSPRHRSHVAQLSTLGRFARLYELRRFEEDVGS